MIVDGRLLKEGNNQQVMYLGFILCLTENRQLLAWQHPRHRAEGLLGKAGFSRIRILNKGFKRTYLELFTLTKEHQTACEMRKTRLVSPPGLELADLNLSHCRSMKDKA